MINFADQWGFGQDKFWLRGERPKELVEFDEELGLWHVYGYPEVVAVFGDSATFSTDSARLFGLDEEMLKYVEGDLAQMTGPEHLHLRGQVAEAFGAGAVADLETRILKFANELLDGLAGRDRFDLLGDFVRDLSGIVFSELLGIPAEDRAFFGLIDQNMDQEAQLTTAEAADVRADRSLVPTLLEETMRYLTPAAASYRATNADVELAGQKIPKDQLVRVWLGAANRDPRQFPDPDTFDASRDHNAHLGFGYGDHFCLGRRVIPGERRI